MMLTVNFREKGTLREREAQYYLGAILKARVYDVATESPLELAGRSRAARQRVLVKREDLQPVFSFKLRGAYNKMASLGRKRLAKGVIAASAGNHAQGVALAAQRLGCRALIVMPVTTRASRSRRWRRAGAEVVLHGDSYADAYAHARRLQRRAGVQFIHALRRSRRDRGAGHDRHGDPAPAHLVRSTPSSSRGRRRPDLRHPPLT